MGLNEGYSQACSQILIKSRLPSINQVYVMLVQDESHKMMTGSLYARTDRVDLIAL